jgi:hypothetical protein
MSINFLSHVTPLWHCAGGINFKFRPVQPQYLQVSFLPYSLLADSRLECKTIHDRLYPQYFLIFIHHYHNHPTTLRSLILIITCEFSRLETDNTERG